MKGQLLIVLPSIIRKIECELEIEFDFCESLRLYLDNFDRVIIACPLSKKTDGSDFNRWRRVKDLPWRNRVHFIPLPDAYRMGEFLRHYYAVKRALKIEIERADYLLFSPHALRDWPTVATYEAIKLRRPYVIDADVVYGEVARVAWSRAAFWKRLVMKTIELPIFERSYRHCLEHSSLALLQGQDVYDAYSPFCSNAHKVYHMPISTEDYITEAQLQTKLNGLNEVRALKLCYIGRAIEMKGPMDWLKTLHELLKSDVKISATWLGDGSLLPSMRSMAQTLGITDYVRFPGYVSSREEIRQTLRQSDLFLFCHKTPESPRCLVESLASGCPLIGYGSAYPKDLVAQCGGGKFSTIGNWRELADIVRNLDRNRERLRDLTKLASLSGRLYERDATMQRRIDLMNECLNRQLLDHH
jgi:glycosyltransferase involved in cell wall biosynthesis